MKRKVEEKTARLMALLTIILSVFLFGGCAGKALNPYNSEFSCPLAEKGKCEGIPQAYADSLKQEKEEQIHDYYPTLSGPVVKNGKNQKQAGNGTGQSSRETDVYRDILFRKLAMALRQPATPFVASPEIIRILILPYKSRDEKLLYFSRYVYVILKEPHWILTPETLQYQP